MPSVCPVCGGARVLLRRVSRELDEGVYALGARAKDVTVPCPVCGADAQKGWIARHCGLEPLERTRKLHHWRVPGFENKAWQGQRVMAKDAIIRALEGRTGLWTFWGDFGSGKTLALQIIVNELRELNTVEGYYAPFAGVLEHLRNLYNAKAETSSYWQRLLDIPVLALDEVTRFKATEWAQQQLFVLVDTRYRRRHSHLTIFATNDDPRQALPPEEDIGYLFSRMREGVLVELRGDVREAV